MTSVMSSAECPAQKAVMNRFKRHIASFAREPRPYVSFRNHSPHTDESIYARYDLLCGAVNNSCDNDVTWLLPIPVSRVDLSETFS